MRCFGEEARTADVLDVAVGRFGGLLRGSDVLYAAVGRCLKGLEPELRLALELAIAEGARLEDVRDVIDVCHRAGGDRSYEFDGKPERFSAELLAALTEFAELLGQVPHEVTLETLLACVLDHPDELDREFLNVLNFRKAADSLRRLIRLHSESLPDLWDEASGRLRCEEFTEDAWAVLERAAQRAADLGYDTVLIPHVFLALLAESEGLTERVVRRQLPPQIGVVRATQIVAGAFRLAGRGLEDVPRLHRGEIGAAVQERLRAAQAEALIWGAEQINVSHLFAVVMAEPSQRLAAVLRGEPLGLDLVRLSGHAREAMLQGHDVEPREVAFKLPSSLPPSEDLTWLARTCAIPPARHLERYFDALCRALHRTRDRHVLLTGLPGVGLTTLLRELARRAAEGEIPFLQRKRFVRVDCRDVSPEQSGAQLSGLINQVGGRTDIVLCLDGLGSLLRGASGTRNNLMVRSALKEQRIHLIGALTGHDFDDLVAADHELLDLTTRIEVLEPDQAVACDMVRQAADELGERFGVTVQDAAVGRAVVLAGDFLPRQRLPFSAVKALRRACENLDFARGGQDAQPLDSIGVEAVVDAVAELSGVPVAQLGGAVGKSVDYEGLLADRVVGQPEAVRVVAQELRRIKSGLAAVSSGPASVLLFAGLTGVGKTELAKAIADLYSASKRLQTYPMENFTEPHSVSGFLGAPPGYIGHESGGRLINDLNADPYCVMLLDEAEKAHPEVLRPFLNLFDEGWVIDQRGTKAYGDRAIFILTSNAGHEVIAEKSARHSAEDEIVAAVRKVLRNVRTRRGELVFTPELLARIRQIVVFRSLDEGAMAGIARKMLARRSAMWRKSRDKELFVAPELVEHAARIGHRLNEDAEGAEGGRIIDKLLADLVDAPVLAAAEERAAQFQACTRIEVRFDAAEGRSVVVFGDER
jgi:ATP-dependent Clp protease ATP-binding subunit ClpA